MIRDIFCCTLLYWLLALVIIFPPEEAVSSGLTIEAMMSSWLGSETMSFVDYHIRRTVVTILAHSLLLPGYFICIQWFFPPVVQYLRIDYHPWLCEGIILLSLVPFFSALYYIYKWSRQEWSKHPMARELSLYVEPDNEESLSWRHKAAQINIEFRRIDKFSTRLNSVSRIVATDSWLIKVTPYFIHTIPVRDAILVLVSSQNMVATTDTSSSGQILTIRTSSIRRGVKPFSFRIPSHLWSELERKLVNPIVNSNQIAIHKTLADRFFPEFEKNIKENPCFYMEIEPDMCIGCMANRANIKLERRCRHGGASSSCQPCSCRPMWCLSCLSTWFAARQNQTEPETWLSSKAPCPTCRSPFCLLDVCLVTLES